MNNSLNKDLYSRFGLQLNLEKVQVGFCSFLKNSLLECLSPLVDPHLYEEMEKLGKTGGEILKESCRQMFLDYSDYRNADYGFKWFIEKIYGNVKGSFEEYSVRLQILLNIIYKHNLVRHELEQLAKEIDSYFQDYPILGLKLKIYKTKAPQVLPSVSKLFNREMENILGLLEVKKYKHVLDCFENGLKEFLSAKNKTQLKSVVEDMHSACDEIVKIILGDKNKGFKHLFKKKEYEKFSLNKNQKEMYRNLKDWMDKIKHGTIKQFNREEVEMIISLTAAFLRFVINKHTIKSKS